LFPILFESGSIVVPTWHALFVVGAISAYFLLHKLNASNEASSSKGHVDGLFVCAYLGGIVGARLLNVLLLEDPTSVSDFFDKALSIGGLTLYGGVILGSLLAILYIKITRENLWHMLDIGVVAMILGLFFGRLGCFFNGDDYGKPVADQVAAPWWSVQIPPLDDGLWRHPAQLYEAGGALIIVLLLLWKFQAIRAKVGLGAVGIIGIWAYGVCRFVVEFYRGDDRGAGFGALSPAQTISVVLVIVAALLFYLRRRWDPSLRSG
jgi:phosphatidylglycerol:prolipoprotein diacylglycerol transferase